ncbi:MAG TPA: pirin family protein [Polyangiales bacterium]|jgi:redox-sensitive bicupin YhaK (pirin superfamily)|nr:pirin family protein [Polyangiales bacterium]
MITLRKSGERHHVRRTHREEWCSFHAERADDGFSLGFGALERFDEHRLEARASVLVRPPRGFEVISYVSAGVVACRDAARRTSILRAGDFQRVSGGDSVGLRQSNASRSQAAHVVQLWLRNGAARRAPNPDQRRFTAAERRGGLRLIASDEVRDDALRLAVDVRIYSALVDPGQNLVHELAYRRSAWLHVMLGEVTCEDAVLESGDAASFALERAVSMTARVPSEVLLVDLAHLTTARTS